MNEAVAAARLGTRTGILCALGKDAAGEMVLGTLRSAGVDTQRVIVSEDHATPVTTMFVREDASGKRYG